MKIRRFLALFLAICLSFPTAFAEAENAKSSKFSIGDKLSQAAGAVSDWGAQTWDSASEWTSQAWDSTTDWATQAWQDTSAWATTTWSNLSSLTKKAWNTSSEWVSQTWKKGATWSTENWNNFVLWVNVIAAGDSYAWIKDDILNNGLLAYDEYIELRTFLKTGPDITKLQLRYDDMLSKLSLPSYDKEVLWQMIQKWSDEKGFSQLLITKLALPYLDHLNIVGEDALGDHITFSGPIVAQYLLTCLEAMEIKTIKKANKSQNALELTLNNLTRPIIIGDSGQNILITDDHYYIENFTYADGKYQIILVATEIDDTSKYPLIRGKNIEEATAQYFKNAKFRDMTELKLSDSLSSKSIAYSYKNADTSITGKTLAIWTEKYCSLCFVVTDQDWNEKEYTEWQNSVSVNNANSISFEADMESDGSFYGVNQTAQKYTINRIFDEEKFTVPLTGHGWAAERGNNLIDNIKGFFRGSHSTVIGDNNAKNGADRVTNFADGSRLLIQTKYYSSAARSISACFENGQFKYIDHVEGKPMAIEVPADQYEQAVEYMKNRIANGEVPGITDTEQAVEIVKKGSLTYQQAKHIAKAGTVESILYDSAHACVVATTSMGISAAIGFAINIWNGEPIEKAIKESIFQGLRTGGTSFLISVFSSQLAKSGLNTAMIPASKVIVHALGPDVSAVIVNAFRPAGSAIYGAAAMQSAAKLLRGNVITATVTFLVLSTFDVADIIQGRISWKQLAKNTTTTALGITGGTLGYLGGAALGTAILPGAGTVVGLIVAVAAGWGAQTGAKKVADIIAEDDADEMIKIIEAQFSQIASEYFLNEKEVEEAITNVQDLITPNMLKQMYQYKNHEEFARQLIEMAIDPVVAKREYVELPSEDEYAEYLTTVLDEIYEDLNNE